jgi:hypothetical protein
VKPIDEMKDAGYEEYWVVYNSKDFAAKELTIYPEITVSITEDSAHGLIVIEGFGRIGALDVEAPGLVRFGEMTRDELFVTVKAAREGLSITNLSQTQNLVMLKHFGPVV